MATLDQIIAEINGVYQPQVNAIEQRRAQIPGMIQAEQAGLDARKESAFEGIVNQARRRGTGVAFGGIPLADQAKYTATDYLPAQARLIQSGREQQMSLTDALNQIYERRNAFAYQIKQNDDQLAESRRQFDANLAFQREQQAAQLRAAAAANAASFAPSIGGGGGAPAPSAARPTAPTQNYIGNNDLRGRLNYAAQREGNKDAAIALKFVGNDGKYNLNPNITNINILNALNRLGAVNVWKPQTRNSSQRSFNTDLRSGGRFGY